MTPLTPLDGFTVGAIAAFFSVTVLASMVRAGARRAQRRREEALVRSAWIGLAQKLQQDQFMRRINFDMPWQDRIRAAQISDAVTFGIRVSQSTPSNP